MAIPTVYNTGTASINAGETALVGQGTSWLTTGIMAGDLFWAAGLSVRIAAVVSNTSITLAYAWPGANRAAAQYEIRREPDEVRVLEASRQLLSTLTNGNLSSIAALTTAANKLAYYSGAGAAALTDLTPAARAILALPGSNGAKVPVVTAAGAAALRDIIGTVAQSSGVPSGAIFERGSNANGEYVRIADGTQICSFRGLAVDCPNAFGGSLFSSATTTWTFPAAFASVTACKVSPDQVFRWGTHAGPGTSTLEFRHLATSASTTAIATNLLAIGRWF